MVGITRSKVIFVFLHDDYSNIRYVLQEHAADAPRKRPRQSSPLTSTSKKPPAPENERARPLKRDHCSKGNFMEPNHQFSGGYVWIC